jgi:hypothetical protein
MATVVWDVRGVLLVDFTPPASAVNAAAYQETLKQGYQTRGPRGACGPPVHFMRPSH